MIANGEPCACGSIGCLEHYASTAALVRRFSKRIAEAGISYPNEEINGELIVRLYKQGDKIAAESLNEHCDFSVTALPDLLISSALKESLSAEDCPKPETFIFRK